MLINCQAPAALSQGRATSALPSRRGRWRDIPFGLVAGALLLQGGLTACAGAAPKLQRDASLSFLCEGGKRFRVEFNDGQVRVTTSTTVYDLDLRRSSIGTKYSSGDTTFILDEDRAVLTGAAGGPFKRCHEA